MKYIAPLEQNFSPFINYLSNEKDKFAVLHSPEGKKDLFYFGCNNAVLEKVVKFLLWQRPVCKMELGGVEESLVDELNFQFSKEGKYSFDSNFFQSVYSREFSVVTAKEKPLETAREEEILSASFEGRRIGLDLGASSIKIWAGENGKEIFSGSVPWLPKEETSLSYHSSKLREAFSLALEKMNGVDAVGISTAGIVCDNRLLMSSLFKNIPESQIEESKDLLFNEALRVGAKKIRIINDGDAAAAAAFVLSKERNVLGLSFGSSLAGGFVNKAGNIPNYLNELAFVPIDLCDTAAIDPWSGDRGTGVDYFSAQAVARYALKSGIEFESGLSNGAISAKVNELLYKGDSRAKDIYETIGICLGYTLPLYKYFYNMDKVLLLGGITNGKAGEYIVDSANKVLSQEFSRANIEILLPNKEIRLTGQAKIAASLP